MQVPFTSHKPALRDGVDHKPALRACSNRKQSQCLKSHGENRMSASDPQGMVRIRIRAREVAPEVESQRSQVARLGTGPAWRPGPAGRGPINCRMETGSGLRGIRATSVRALLQGPQRHSTAKFRGPAAPCPREAGRCAVCSSITGSTGLGAQ